MRKLGVASVVLVVLLGCGKEATETSASSVVGATGGTVTAGGATLVIPPGALGQDTTITVAVSSPDSSLPESGTVRGSIFDFGPDGITFSVPATLTLPMDGTPAANQRAVISFLDRTTDRWVDVPSTVSGAQISAPIAHFTPYAARLGLEPSSEPRREWGLYPTKKEPSWGFPTSPSLVGDQIGGEVRVPFLFGAAAPTFEQDNGATPGLAMGEVYSSPSGDTFSAYAEAPSGDPNLPDFRSGGVAFLRQFQSYVKRAPDASLRIVVSGGFLAASDHNGRPLAIECGRPLDNLSDEAISQFCMPLRMQIEFKAVAFKGPPSPFVQPEFFHVHGGAYMFGFDGKWKFSAGTWSPSSTPLWTEAHFTATDLDSRDPLVTLTQQRVIDVDLSSVALCPPELDASACLDKEFTLFSYVNAETWNWRGRESGAASFIKDPQEIGGAALLLAGLEATNNPLPLPATQAAPPLPCASGLPDPAAGVLSLSAATYSAPEGLPRVQGIVVTRTEGSKGAVSVTFTPGGGTATAGADFSATSASVVFGDGDTAPRFVELGLLDDALAEPAETLDLTLSEPGGCALLGTQASAVLTILDDDTVIAPPDRYTVGGTVNGLIGTVVLEDHHSIFLEIFEDGPFTFTALPTPSGQPYSVRVFNQPRNPVQVCTVTNGTGVFTDHDVTDVVVTCVGQ